MRAAIAIPAPRCSTMAVRRPRLNRLRDPLDDPPSECAVEPSFAGENGSSADLGEHRFDGVLQKSNRRARYRWRAPSG